MAPFDLDLEDVSKYPECAACRDYYKEGEMVYGREIKKPSRPPRFFLAHAKSCDDAELERLVSALSGLLDRFSNGKPYDLILGRAYFEARFKECGSWDAWAMEVGGGMDPVTRAPLFQAIFVPVQGEAIGAGTARIVDFALKGSRRVIAFDLEGKSAKVVGLRKVQGGTWQNGWSLVVDRNLV